MTIPSHPPHRRPAGAPPSVVPLLLSNGIDVTWVDPDIAARYGHLRFTKRDRRGYISTTISGRNVYLHRLVLGTADGRCVHHRDGNPSHNWRANLVDCLCAQNAMRRRKLPGRTSQYQGVSWCREKKRYRAAITVRGTTVRLGWFRDEIAAAHARDRAVRALRDPDFWTLNFPDGDPNAARFSARNSADALFFSEPSSRHIASRARIRRRRRRR